ncbi:MAG: transcriptional regulator [Bacteroidetes bacterium]|jgi:DNA-binding MarR family transcriptional regulator|nr:transcriptional regulator [Bacteroidota bacterium]
MNREELFTFINKIDDPLKDSAKILSNLHYTHHYLIEKYKRLLEKYALTPIQSNVLGIIHHSFPKSLSLEEIKEMVLEPNSDVSRTVVRLAEKGFVEKVINKDNRRKVSIKATSKGIKAMEKMMVDSAFTKFTSQISLKEAREFIKTLSKLRAE